MYIIEYSLQKMKLWHYFSKNVYKYIIEVRYVRVICLLQHVHGAHRTQACRHCDFDKFTNEKKKENKIISVDRQLNDSTKIAIIMASYINWLIMDWMGTNELCVRVYKHMCTRHSWLANINFDFYCLRWINILIKAHASAIVESRQYSKLTNKQNGRK